MYIFVALYASYRLHCVLMYIESIEHVVCLCTLNPCILISGNIKETGRVTYPMYVHVYVSLRSFDVVIDPLMW